MRIATLLTALILALGAAGAARADARFVAAEPGAQPFHLGSLRLTALHDAQIIVANDGKTFGLGVGTRAVGNVLRAAGAPPDQITLSANALLVRTGRQLVLIDTGVGPRYHGALLGSLSLPASHRAT